MSETTGAATLSSIFEIPYQDWNRPHLLRRASAPHRTRAQARGHRYTPSEQDALQALRGFVGNKNVSKTWSMGTAFRPLFRIAGEQSIKGPRSKHLPIREGYTVLNSKGG